MEAFLIYLLKSAGVILLFLGCYHFFLRKETFFKQNRFFLITGIVASVIVPLIKYTRIIWVNSIIPDLITSGQITSSITKTAVFDWSAVALTIYTIGVFIFTARFIIQLLSLQKLIAESKLVKKEGFYFVEIHRDTVPFSFFKYIVYNPTQYSKIELDTILIHEKIHARSYHSLDIILIHLMSILQWFNPFIWWYKKSINQNLEFIADTQTIEKNQDKSNYLYLMLKSNTTESNFSIVNPFFNSLLKKRIFMLNKKHSKKRNLAKYGIILPLIIGYIALFNVETNAQTNPAIQNNEIIEVRATNPLQGDINPLVIIDGKESTKKVMEELDPNKVSSIEVLKNEKAIESYGQRGKDGVIIIRLKKSEDSLIKIEGYANSPAPLYIIDGKQSSKKQLEKLHPNKIKSVNVIKDKKALVIYGKKGKNGVIEITTKKKK